MPPGEHQPGSDLGNITALCRRQGVKPIFVPQIANYGSLTSDKPYGWLPYVRDRDLKTVMAAYNQTMARVAKEEGVGFANRLLDETFVAGEFIDNSHFSFGGDQHFAGVLASQLRQSLLLPESGVTNQPGQP